MNFSAQMGLETVGQMASFTFSRWNPRKSNGWSCCLQLSSPPCCAFLKQFYKDYTLFFTDPLFKNEGLLCDQGHRGRWWQVYRSTR